MLDNLKKYQILLASNSPRRRELLAGLGISYEVTALPDVDESYPETLEGTAIPEFIAQTKAEAYREMMNENTLLITADTIVWLDGKVYGKPADRAEAKAMLTDLSGKTHQVITGVCICTSEKEICFHDLTDVTFSCLSENEIDYYLDNFKPYDKAGSYGVQEWIGYVAVDTINGSYYNVMGLPIHKLYEELKKI